jgi:multiple antibiotic resistance protein
MHHLFSIAFSIFLLIDSIGNIPLFLVALKGVSPRRQMFIILRENLIALVFILAFNFLGEPMMRFLNISHEIVGIAGGLILFLTALRMVFPGGERFSLKSKNKEPFIVPLAIPLIAGPAVLAAVTLLSSQENDFVMIGAIGIAWVVSLLILLAAPLLNRLMGERGITACEKLMGLVLILIATQMFLGGIRDFFSVGVYLN